MGLIVHLTDLHLGSKGAGTATDDRKLPVVRTRELTTRRDDAVRAIKQLTTAIKANGKTISALVISGDVTTANSLEGFADLRNFLSESFGKMLPDPTRIVAIPGNHDVAWFEQDASRYAGFNEYCVKSGYITPPLEGLTLDDGAKIWTPSDKHALVDFDERWAIVPINSTDFSGVRTELVDESGNLLSDETAVDAVQTALAANPLHAAIFEQLRKSREYDMARVSKSQIVAFGRTVEHVERKFGSGEKPLLLATLHHQLSPVDEPEEIKPFESLSNLGRVRTMLQENGVNIVFHGHKHRSRIFWDSREDATSDGRSRGRHDMLVVAGGTIGGGGTKEMFANVVEIEPRRHGHDVKVWSLGDYLHDAGRLAKQAIFFDRRRVSPVEPGAGLIAEPNFDAAYARLEREAALQTRVNDLVVRIADGQSACKPPAGYPVDASGEGGPDDAKLGEWFVEITDWWQSQLIEAPNRLFTHGRRLRLYDGKADADQIDAIARIIKHDPKPGNGRAIATLIDPETDTLPVESGAPTSFPAFCLVQLHISNDGGSDRLDATAYFRKQEMRYWWPVNVAEIRYLMSKVIEDMEDIEIGAITTVSSIAEWQPTRPRVAIPKVDRLYLQDHEGRTTLSKMAALLSVIRAEPTGWPERDSAQQMWNAVLDDIVPPADSARDSIPVAVEGVRFLRRSVEAQHAVATIVATRTRLHHAATALKSLEDAGLAVRDLSTGTGIGNWRGQLRTQVELMSKAREELAGLVLAACKATTPTSKAKRE